jgi:hypothetical protein
VRVPAEAGKGTARITFISTGWKEIAPTTLELPIK